jgi:predicted amidohydrolase YtcJ
MQVDLVLTGGPVLTLAHDDPEAGASRAAAIAVHQGRVVAVGDEADLPPARSRIDLGGACVVPGLADVHNHMAWFGLGLEAIDLRSLTSLEQLYDVVAKKAGQSPPDAVVTGTGYDDNRLGGHPNLDRLDAAAGGRRVWLTHRSGHMCTVNTPVLEWLGVLDGTAEVPEGGRIHRRDGRPTGLLQEQAQNLVTAALTPYSLAELRQAVSRASRIYAREGLTHVTECGIGAGWLGKSPLELGAYLDARDSGELVVRVQLMPSIDSLHDLAGHADDPGDLGLDLGMRTGMGDDRVRVGPVKIWLDGSLLGRTAALSEPYTPRPGDEPTNAGFLQDDPARMRDRILRAHASGWTVAAHAIGDVAVEFALDVFEEAAAVVPRPGVRHRIEHAGLTSSSTARRMAQLGVTPIPQMRFLHDIGDSMLEAVGRHRADQLYRHRSFLQAGCRVPGSSDRPVADGAPLLGMASMVERRTAAGEVIGPSERVDALTALRAYTTDAAWVAGDERARGRLAPGYLADLVVVDRDPTESTPEEIAATQVLATVLGGSSTFDSGLGLPVHDLGE